MVNDIQVKLPVNAVLLVAIVLGSEYFGVTSVTPIGRRYGYDSPPV